MSGGSVYRQIGGIPVLLMEAQTFQAEIEVWRVVPVVVFG
jgi:hypothetical protein